MAEEVKEILTVIKLQCPGGAANPAPPIGPALGQHGINIQEFCAQFNNATSDKKGQIIPVEISVFKDRTFSFITKTPPAPYLIKQAIKLKKGSGVPNKEKVGTISWQQLKKIAEIKMADLNATDIDHAAKMIAGTARSMGIEVEGKPEGV